MKGIKFKRATTPKNSNPVNSELSNQINPNTENGTQKAIKDNIFKQLFGKVDKKSALTGRDQKDNNTSGNKTETKFGTYMLKEVGSKLSIRKGLGAKISFLFVITLISTVAIVGFLLYSFSKSTLEKNIIGAGQETIKQVARNIDTTLSNNDDFSFQLMFDDTLNKSLADYMSDDMYLRIAANRTITELLSTYIFSNNQIRNIAIIPHSSNYKPIANGLIVSNPDKLLSTEQYHEKPWFSATVDKRGGTLWIASQVDGILEFGASDTIALARSVTNITKGNEYIIVIEFASSELFNATNNVEIIDNSYLEIVNSENVYIKSDKSEDQNLEANFDIKEAINSSELGNIFTKHKQTNKDYIVVYNQLNENQSWYLFGAIPIDEIEKEINPIFIFIFIVICVVAVLALIIGLFMMRMISHPLTQITTIMTKGAKGDLTVRAPKMSRDDEIGELARTFDDMMIQIEGLARQTTSSAQQVLLTAADLTQASQKTATSGKEISIATDEIAAGSSALAMEAEKGSDLTHNISLQMNQVNQSREQMNSAANQVDQASEQGLTYMSGLIERTGETEEMVAQMVNKVNSLSDSTKSIVKILDVLNNITKQTNILSLNATIEAARAGQAGKGFMVVADEIRQLADQSRQSIDIVGQITNTISNEIVETVHVLKQAQPIFQEQILSVKEANQIFISVRSQMDSLKQNINEVSSAFDHLNESQHTLSQSMNNVSSVAQQSSATSEEVASLSSEQLVISEQLVNLSTQLEMVSSNLKTQLSNFRISNE